jgi:hypothetical protein
MELEKFKILCADELLLFFLPNFLIDSPLSNMLISNYFGLFNGFYPDIVKYFRDFISNEYLMSKIISMFKYIYQYISKFTIRTIETSYCGLGYDMRYFGDYEDEVEIEIEMSKKVDVISQYLKEIAKKVITNLDFINNKI